MQGYYNSICFLPCFTLFFIIYKCLLLFSHSVVSHSLQPHGLQHARLTCPSQPHCVCLNSCLLNQWCHPTISSSATPFSFCLQSLPASGSLSVSQLFAVRCPTDWSFSFSNSLPMSIQGWFPLGLTGWISLQSKRLSRVFSRTTIWKHQIIGTQPSLWSSSHICTWLLEKL